MHCHQQNIECHALNDLCIRMLQKYSGLARRYHFAKYSAHVFHFFAPALAIFHVSFSRDPVLRATKDHWLKTCQLIENSPGLFKSDIFRSFAHFRECFVVFKKDIPRFTSSASFYIPKLEISPRALSISSENPFSNRHGSLRIERVICLDWVSPSPPDFLLIDKMVKIADFPVTEPRDSD